MLANGCSIQLFERDPFRKPGSPMWLDAHLYVITKTEGEGTELDSP